MFFEILSLYEFSFGRYFYNMYIYTRKFEIVFSFNVKDNNIFPYYKIPITYRNSAVLFQLECLHKTVNMAVFFVQNNENTCTHTNELFLKQQKGISNTTHKHFVVKQILFSFPCELIYQAVIQFKCHNGLSFLCEHFNYQRKLIEDTKCEYSK